MTIRSFLIFRFQMHIAPNSELSTLEFSAHVPPSDRSWCTTEFLIAVLLALPRWKNISHSRLALVPGQSPFAQIRRAHSIRINTTGVLLGRHGVGWSPRRSSGIGIDIGSGGLENYRTRAAKIVGVKCCIESLWCDMLLCCMVILQARKSYTAAYTYVCVRDRQYSKRFYHLVTQI
ncbi:hypothetical protein BDD12DRAFT_115776 [Trichophaea hybrida]|nr:hypothetical protein BDD12DRAFT_115776 [Trichophaea hybrida]